MALRMISRIVSSFHHPMESGTTYSVVRVFYAVLFLAQLVILRPFLGLCYGRESICPLPPDPAYPQCGWAFWNTVGQFSFFSVFDSPAQVQCIWWAAVACTICLGFGLWIRLFSVLQYLFVSSFFLSDCGHGNYGDQIFAATSVLFLAMPSRQNFSIDRWLYLRRSGSPADARTAEALFSPWLRRTCTCYLAIIYATGVLARLDGWRWWDGSAVWVSLADPLNSVVWRILAEHPRALPQWFFSSLTYGSLLYESGFVLLIWFTRAKVPLVCAGIAFHLALGFTMNLGLFPFQMCLLLIACIPGKELSNHN